MPEETFILIMYLKRESGMRLSVIQGLRFEEIQDLLFALAGSEKAGATVIAQQVPIEVDRGLRG